ncbi:MAG TPA: hypothetical protein VF458_09975 [Ktedonobacteraceae bacterium]
MKKVRVFWIACIVLIALALVARIYAIWPTLKVDVGNQFSHSVSQLLPTQARPHLRPDLATGMIFPQWGQEAYTSSDPNWMQGLQEIQRQTAARWIGMYIQFHQASASSPVIRSDRDTPTPAAIARGARQARQMGYHVYVFPTITLDNNHAWAGTIKYADAAGNQTWFTNYWQLLKPYAQACAAAGCERFSIGNEYEGLERAPGSYWHQLLAHVRSVYPGQIVYNMNFSSQLMYGAPAWMSDSLLTAVGVSSYYSVTTEEVSAPRAQLPALWRSRVEAHLDKLSMDIGKPVFISEIGYRDTNYAGYKPYQAVDDGQRDDQMQAALYNAALEDIATDHQIDGIFIWAWSVPPFAPNDKPAAQVLQQWFEKL